MRRSFPDSGVLIDAARGLPPFDRIAFDYFVAAASLLGADELVTTERPLKPIYRNRQVEVVYPYAHL